MTIAQYVATQRLLSVAFHWTLRSAPCFLRRCDIPYDRNIRTACWNLHAPCGLVRITVLIQRDGDSVVSDPSRLVSFICVPCFITARDIHVNIPTDKRWPGLQNRAITVSFCYGGTFTCLVFATELGFKGLAQPVPIDALNRATRMLKEVINAEPLYRRYITHLEYDESSTLYTVMMVEKVIGQKLGSSKGAETSLCFFSDQQVGRSPTESAITVRVAHSYASGDLKVGQMWTYHVLVSNATHGVGEFVGTAVERVPELFNEKTRLYTDQSES
ncbi:hypothetical protein ACN47E_002036 [Coniothyrium glycines]